jgi:gliding motility-associated-like protein
MSYFFSFHTGTDPSGAVDIHITPGDCNTFLGPDAISCNIVELSTGVNPCFPVGSGYIGTCQGSATEFTASYSGLNPDHDYLVMVGSNHDTLYGPCTFGIDISGPAVQISASVNPFLISLGESATLNVIGAGSNQGYSWSPQSWLDNQYSASPISTPEQTTNYTVTSQIGNCTVTDNVTVTVGPPIFIYNSFTPNGDGVNDTWVIPGVEKFENIEVNVYDRWGQNVFRSIGYAQPWDGTNKGRFLPTGPYYYHIELNSLDVSIAPFTGEVSIIH